MSTTYENKQDTTEAGAGLCVTFLHSGISSSVYKSAPGAAEANFESPAANLKQYELQLNETVFSPLKQIFHLSLCLPCCLP